MNLQTISDIQEEPLEYHAYNPYLWYLFQQMDHKEELSYISVSYLLIFPHVFQDLNKYSFIIFVFHYLHNIIHILLLILPIPSIPDIKVQWHTNNIFSKIFFGKGFFSLWNWLFTPSIKANPITSEIIFTTTQEPDLIVIEWSGNYLLWLFNFKDVILITLSPANIWKYPSLPITISVKPFNYLFDIM